MGYSMRQVECNFFIPKKYFKEVLRAIKDAARSEELMYADVKNLARSKTLAKAMSECLSWEPTVDKTGITGLTFIGEKIGSEDVWMSAIAKYVKRGSYITMSGDDGYSWKWLFTGKKLKELEGQVSYR